MALWHYPYVVFHTNVFQALVAYANHDTTVGLYRVSTLKWFLCSWTHLSVFAVDDVMFSFSLQDIVLTQLFSIHFFYLWFPCLVFIIARMVQNQFVLVLVKSSSFFSYSNTASEEFAVHQWTWHMQGWQVLDENVHIGEVPENVGTGDIWKKIWKLKKKKSSYSWPKQWKLNPTKKYAICIKSCTTLPSKTDTFATLTEVLK